MSNVVLSCERNPFLIGSEINRVTVTGGIIISMGLGLDEAHIRNNHILDVPDGTSGTIPAESAAGLFSIIINLNGKLAFVRQYIESDVTPAGLSGTVVWWQPIANIMQISADGGATWADWHGAKVGEAYWNGSQITGISCKMPYHILTYDDYSALATAIKGISPALSNKQPLPFWTNAPFAVSAGWVAPVDGWMRFGWWSNGNNQKAYIDNVEVGQLGTGGNAVAITSVCPIKAGQTFGGNPSSAYFIRGYNS